MKYENENFCGSIAAVVCASCPLAERTEKEWEQSVQSGITPFDVALDFNTAIRDVRDFVEPQPVEVAEDESTPYAEFLYEYGTDFLREAKADEQSSEALDYVEWLQIATLERHNVSSDLPADDAADARAKVARSAMDCFMQQGAPACTLPEKQQAISSEYTVRMGKDSGVDVLNDFARHGTLQEVREMCARVQEVLEDIYDRLGLRPGTLVDFNAISEPKCREYLSWMAERFKLDELA